MWELDYKEGWALNFFQIVVLEKTFESPLDSKEIKPVSPKGDQPWIFIGSTDDEGEALILWPPDSKRQFTGKDSHAGKDWGQEKRRETENEMFGWRQWLNGHESEQIQGVSVGQETLECCSSWGHRKSGRTWWLNNKCIIIFTTKILIPQMKTS